MQRCRKRLLSKGSITVEACIILPVFLSVFFLLLFLVKFTCTGMALDFAVNEAAKEIAASAYPISFINEIEDEKIEEYGNTAISNLGEEFENPSGNSKKEDIPSILKCILEDYGKGIIGDVIGEITPEYWDMKSSVKYMIADGIIEEHLDSPLINRENVRLRLVEFPQGGEEYKARSESMVYEDFGLTPGEDFCSDDIVLQLEYGYRVNLPFMKALNIKMVHTAVERAWIKGSFGILTAEDEGLDLQTEGRIVYITRTGIRYHEENCRYLRKSKIPINLEEAEARGYTPCKVCKPPHHGG